MSIRDIKMFLQYVTDTINYNCSHGSLHGDLNINDDRDSDFITVSNQIKETEKDREEFKHEYYKNGLLIILFDILLNISILIFSKM